MTRDARPIFTGGGKTPLAMSRSSVRLEIESFCAACGRVKRSLSSLGVRGVGKSRSGGGAKGEVVIGVQFLRFRNFAVRRDHGRRLRCEAGWAGEGEAFAGLRS